MELRAKHDESDQVYLLYLDDKYLGWLNIEKEQADYLVKAVNEYEGLEVDVEKHKKSIEMLGNSIEYLKSEYGKLTKENVEQEEQIEQLKEENERLKQETVKANYIFKEDIEQAVKDNKLLGHILNDAKFLQETIIEANSLIEQLTNKNKECLEMLDIVKKTLLKFCDGKHTLISKDIEQLIQRMKEG
ncbi:MAG: hypothetical protein ACM3UU_02900 [Ignavibacteriales bacterium]